MSLPRAARAGSDVRIFALNPSTCATSSRDDAALLRALEIELSSLPLERAEQATAARSPAVRVVVSVECNADTDAVTLRIRSGASSQVEQRSIVLRDVPEAARPRTLALVIAEALGSELSPAASDLDAPPSEAPSDAPAAAPQSPARPRKPLRATLFTTRDPYPGSPYDAPAMTDDPAQASALRLGVGTQARLALDPTALLFAFEANARGPIERYIGWGVEASYAAVSDTATERGRLDVRWWNASAGFDLVPTRRADILIGPRLSVSHFTASNRDGSLATEATLGTQLGGRATFTSRLGGETSLAVTFAAQRTLGVAALGPYTGLDTAFHGWLVSWGLGVAFEP